MIESPKQNSTPKEKKKKREKKNVISFPLLGPCENNLKCSLLISAIMKMVIFLLDCL